jgi:hypothetical protein
VNEGTRKAVRGIREGRRESAAPAATSHRQGAGIGLGDDLQAITFVQQPCSNPSKSKPPHSQAPSTNPNTEPSTNSLRLLLCACSFTWRPVKHVAMKRR